MALTHDRIVLVAHLADSPWVPLTLRSRATERLLGLRTMERCPDLGWEFFPHAAQATKLVRRRRRLGNRWTTVTFMRSHR